ncbi:MAG: proteasome subunit beta, partial [Candidatus Korarchaeota archaeon]|nr:proteasome subunit beta [Candidatus Korarchaeota archaeon]NIU85406.1 proteasome subunit beta [Candidatus Thorarchaeota archaeon]NIW15503.1 proteasome subunit beta [Candidatus Thorarchaeota archaeon]NIW53448.1 proteasome subunit beta [Candidatus Korarchaeota archaeon]
MKEFPYADGIDMKKMKGTTTVGMTFKGGVVLIGDKRAAAGHVVASRTARKIKPITDDIGLTISGSVAGAQILYKWIRSQISRLIIDTERKAMVSGVANLTSTIL